MAIDIVFIIAFLVIIGLCVQVLVTGRGRRIPYALLLASATFYTVFLSLDLVGSGPPTTHVTITEVTNVSDVMAFFNDIAFPFLFFAIATFFIKRRTLAFEKAGTSNEPAGIAEVLIMLMGIVISGWLFISGIVHTGLNISSNVLILKIDKSSSRSEAVMQDDVRRQLRVFTAEYAVTAAQCSACLYVAFIAIYRKPKEQNRALLGHDEAAKWMAYLFPPLCLAYFTYLLFFTITGSPKIHLNVFKTINSLFRENLTEAVLRAMIPFLMSLVLIVVGLNQSLWNRALDSEFKKMQDGPRMNDSDTKTIDV